MKTLLVTMTMILVQSMGLAAPVERLYFDGHGKRIEATELRNDDGSECKKIEPVRFAETKITLNLYEVILKEDNSSIGFDPSPACEMMAQTPVYQYDQDINGCIYYESKTQSCEAKINGHPVQIVGSISIIEGQDWQGKEKKSFNNYVYVTPISSKRDNPLGTWSKSGWNSVRVSDLKLSDLEMHNSLDKIYTTKTALGEQMYYHLGISMEVTDVQNEN
ncbi:MAG: hypothetical protein ACK5P5_02525 [Pseudobdellovibrionaceae bacterium]|jgi:hypothetical protein